MNTQARDLAKGLIPPECSARRAWEERSPGKAPAIRMRRNECRRIFARRLGDFSARPSKEHGTAALQIHF